MNGQNEERDYNSAYNPFPEPQTIPAGWDMSEFIAEPQVDSAATNDDSLESEMS